MLLEHNFLKFRTFCSTLANIDQQRQMKMPHLGTFGYFRYSFMSLIGRS